MSFMPARVLLQDFTGVPCVVDLAAMRDGIVALGGDPQKVNPLQPVELVIDHSVQVDHFATSNALELNADLEYHRNRERYVFLRWGQTAFRNFRVVPPETGHRAPGQHRIPGARRCAAKTTDGGAIAYPDTVFGTDSHTTMVNGLGVVGWGVGGIEAEAAMLGQPSSMLIPPVLGYRLTGKLPEGATATDLVLTITEAIRKRGVVGKFVEFFGSGLAHLTIADRVTLGNMCPEYGSTVAIFPIDDMTLEYLRLTGRDAKQVALVEAYAKAQGLFRTADSKEAVYSETMELDLSTVEPSLAGPRRPQDRVSLSKAKRRSQPLSKEVEEGRQGRPPAAAPPVATKTQLEPRFGRDRRDHQLHEHLNPSVMIGAGLWPRRPSRRA
jgi:aconitate hydratase